MQKARRNDPCPCGSGKKYKNCCFEKNYLEITPNKKIGHFTADDGAKISMPITTVDSIPTHNKNGLTPDISSEQLMDLCIDEIHTVLEQEKAGMMHDLVDFVILKMDVVPTFTYRQITERMKRDGRFEVIHDQICGLKGTDPIALMAEKIR
jgi:hypothetical protein